MECCIGKEWDMHAVEKHSRPGRTVKIHRLLDAQLRREERKETVEMTNLLRDSEQ